MSDQRVYLERYEPPCIEDRQRIDFPLIGQQSGSPSAVFRTDQVTEE